MGGQRLHSWNGLGEDVRWGEKQLRERLGAKGVQGTAGKP